MSIIRGSIAFPPALTSVTAPVLGLPLHHPRFNCFSPCLDLRHSACIGPAPSSPLLLSQRLYWACPFIPHIFRRMGLMGLGPRLGFEASYSINFFTRLLTLPIR